MVIAKKSEKNLQDIEHKKEEYLSKGGFVTADMSKKKEKRKPVLIRVHSEWLEKIDKAVEGRCGMNRTVWILQAIQEKLESKGND